MGAKHTQGPWFPVFNNHFWECVIPRDGEASKYCPHVAYVWPVIGDADNRASPEEISANREANARLIAAAPDLLEALGALGVIGCGYCFCGQNRDPEKQDHEPKCRDARAAIAKATQSDIGKQTETK